MENPYPKNSSMEYVTVSKDKERFMNFAWLHSVWRMNTVNPFLHNYDPETNTLKETHIAPFPQELAHRLIDLYSEKGDIVLDPFCGSGTTNFMALSLFRKTIGYDIEEKYIRMAAQRCANRGAFFCKSSASMNEIADVSVQLCITSPPYLYLRHYSDNPNNIGNLKNPYFQLRRVFEEIFRVLRYDGYFCLNVSDVPEEGRRKLTTFPYDLIYVCMDIGFQLMDTIIWDKEIVLKKWNMENRRIKRNHEYIWVFRKPRQPGNQVAWQSNAIMGELQRLAALTK